jgi:2-oxoglutarate ferredoxin oxidoreductase subunit gamma
MGSDGLYEEIIMAGFGGQGIMLAGKLLAQAAMIAGKEVTYMPSYGAEVRGGTANCMVVVADEPIACPVVDKPDSLIVMNKAALNKFAQRLKPGGLLVMNSSLIDIEPEIDDDADVIKVPADELAVALGTVKSANMVALGVYLQRCGYLSVEQVVSALPAVLAERHRNTLAANIAALQRGAEFALSVA